MSSQLAFLAVGFLAGLLARALVSGKSPTGLIGTTILGVVGSFVGGFLGYAIFGKDLENGSIQASGFVGSLIGAILVLMIYKRVRR